MSTISPATTWTLGLAATLSFVGSLFVLITYALYPVRQHPAGIMFGMTLYNAMYSLLFLISIVFVTLECDSISWLAEFFMFGQEIYLLMFSADLLLSLKNPFGGERTRMRLYHTLAATFSFIFAAASPLDNSMFGFCWLQDLSLNRAGGNNDGEGGVVFALLIIIVYFVSLGAIFKSWKVLTMGLPDTFAARKRILRQLKYYVGTLFGYWTIVFILYFIFTATTGKLRERTWYVFTFFLSAKGVAHAAVWAKTSNIFEVFRNLRNGGNGLLPENSDTINWALRREILNNTTKGICLSVEKAEKGAAYMDKDIIYSQLEEFPIRGTEQAATFKDYAPHAFRILREMVSISSAEYISSMKATTKERFSEGKSGAFFYFTQNKKYIVKTLTKEELTFLLQILPQYTNYVRANPETLIARFFGCHAITMYGKTVHFVVLQSIFDTRLPIHERYDLKGAWVGRLEGRKPVGTVAVCKYCSKEYIVGGSEDQICESRSSGLKHNYEQVGKDLNWNRRLNISPLIAYRLAEQLVQDAGFLNSVDSIDYSLLVGVHYRSFEVTSMGDDQEYVDNEEEEERGVAIHPLHKKSNAPFFKEHNGGMNVCVVEGPGVYFMGLIDILQPWNLRKKLEHFFKAFILCQNKRGISTVNPRLYATRFQERVARDLILDPAQRALKCQQARADSTGLMSTIRPSKSSHFLFESLRSNDSSSQSSSFRSAQSTAETVEPFLSGSRGSKDFERRTSEVAGYARLSTPTVVHISDNTNAASHLV